MDLAEAIAQQIRQDGPISFSDFMERCLYDPEHGYYTAKCDAIGASGDFYTSATLSPVFGALLAKQLEEMWVQMGYRPFTIVEYGAGTGQLCQDIMSCLETNAKMYADLRYCIIEKSPAMCRIAKDLLSDKVQWYDSISDISDLNGCILSNELVDNFAVHRVVMAQELMEIYVDYQDGFSEALFPARSELKNYLSELKIQLPKGYHTEINLEALDWITQVASCLKSGYVMTIDYGDRNAELYKPGRSKGTLLCYYKHAVNDSFYEHIGHQDITSFVNFSALSHWGKENGLSAVGFSDQRCFLISLGFREQLLKILSQEQDVILAAQKAINISRILLMDMGSKYKVLIQEKERRTL